MGEEGYAGIKPEDAVKFVYNMVEKHTEKFRNSLPMIASENLISPLARKLLVSDLTDRYAEGLPRKRYYQGNEFFDEIEILGTELAKKLFRAEEADLRPISGTVANMAVFFAFAEPGDVYTALSLNDGAHISSAAFGAAGLRGLKEVTYPFDYEIMNIDVDKTIKMLKEVRPKLALFGRSVFLFPTPLKELRDTLEDVGAVVWYDGAHVLGLIAGGKFQDPLREGAHVMTGSTHKTLPGPQGGIVLCNPKDEDMWKQLRRRIFPGVVSNHHLHHVAAKVVALAEHMVFGAEYASQIIRNAKTLAEALYEEGFKVLGEHLGFTESHTILVDVRNLGGGAWAAEQLEKANIIANKNLIPNDPGTSMKPSGIRLGTQELTRIGMKEPQMREIAEYFRRVLIDKEDPERVKTDVTSLKSQFQKIHYCFKEEEAYKFWDLA